MAWFTTDWSSSHHTVRCAHKLGDVISFIIVACRISSWLKWYKNYKNRLRLTKVIVKNKMSHFLWFTVYIHTYTYIVSLPQIVRLKLVFDVNDPFCTCSNCCDGEKSDCFFLIFATYEGRLIGNTFSHVCLSLLL